MRLPITFLAVIVIPLFFIEIFNFYNAQQALVKERLSHLETVASIQEARISQVIESNLERVRLVSSRTQLRLSLDRYNKEGNIEDKENMRRILLDARSSISDFKDIFIVSLDGTVIVSTEEHLENEICSTEEFFIKGKEAHHMFVLRCENDNPLIYLSGPLLFEYNLLGVVVVTANIDSINAITGDYAGLGETCETVLAKRDENGDALFITPLRFDSDAALKRSVDKDSLDVSITQALLENEATFTDMMDYRKELVFAATRYIEAQDWGAVVKIDKAEALAPINNLRNIFLLIGFVTTGLVGGLTFLYLTDTKRLQEELIKSEKLANIGRGVKLAEEEIRNPLILIEQATHIAEEDEKLNRDMIGTIRKNIGKIKVILKQLREEGTVQT